MTGEEKQERLFEIMRSYGIKNVSQLGPGTNRYAFKINGYAVKFAVNTDGIIDNFKEFKMSPLLQPYVIQCHEVSEDGILLVTEYIQAFTTFQDMLRYEDKIKRILDKLGEIYVFGDVGIVKRNFANWGLRIGRDEPVCLDFAYVYALTSELFLCTSCTARAILISTDNYSAMRCPVCNKVFSFEDIRRRIGNDLHRHEIGDLRESGYLLTESNTVTTLDEVRSPYLGYKRKKEKEVIIATKEEEPVKYFDFSLKPEDIIH
jgi:hypothetical protein